MRTKNRGGQGKVETDGLRGRAAGGEFLYQLLPAAVCRQNNEVVIQPHAGLLRSGIRRGVLADAVFAADGFFH